MKQNQLTFDMRLFDQETFSKKKKQQSKMNEETIKFAFLLCLTLRPP